MRIKLSPEPAPSDCYMIRIVGPARGRRYKRFSIAAWNLWEVVGELGCRDAKIEIVQSRRRHTKEIVIRGLQLFGDSRL